MVSFYGYSIIFLIIIEFYELNVLNNLWVTNILSLCSPQTLFQAF